MHIIYKSVLAAFNDLVDNTLKTLVCEKLSNVIKNDPAIQNAVRDYFVKDFCQRFPDTSVGLGHSIKFASDTATQWIVDVVGKYVSEALGLTATIYVDNITKLNKKMSAKGEKRLNELKEIELDTYSGKITGAQATTKTLGLVCRSVDDLLAKDNFDSDIKIGDSTLRINILENLSALVDFLWDNTFGLIMPKEDLKPEPVTDCTVYYRILP